MSCENNMTSMPNQRAELSAGHIHESHHAEPHGHEHPAELGKSFLAIRSHSGISGDMLLAGLAVLSLEKDSLDPQGEAARAWLGSILDKIMPMPRVEIKLELTSVRGINGWRLALDLPPEREHRRLADIEEIIRASSLAEAAKKRAFNCFELLAECEGAVHALPPNEVHFHEVGALDSIIDICCVCEIYTLLGSPRIVCGPLPVCDGQIHCAHGLMPAPAPATLRLLRGLPVKPFAGSTEAGELITPTGIALLRALHAHFGPWPAFSMEYNALVYGQRVFENAPNGVIFAMGKQ